MQQNHLEEKAETLLQLLNTDAPNDLITQKTGEPINPQLEATIASLLDTLDPREVALIHQVFGFEEDPLPLTSLSSDMKIAPDLLEAQLNHALAKLRSESKELADAAG